MHEGSGEKGKGAGALYLYSLYCTLAGGQCRSHLVCKPSGLTHSEAGRVSSAKGLDHGPGGTHFAPPVGNRSVFGWAQETSSCCVGLYTCGRQQAVVLGTEARSYPTGCAVEALLQQTPPPGMAFRSPCVPPCLGYCSTCSRMEPSCWPFSKRYQDSSTFLGYTRPWEQDRADDDCARYPSLTGMWAGTSRKRFRSRP
ncbi:hypothetical protein N658DRAFT_2594 [Parathielavia hyrcaniae]|uniref:Uncharacterized protein n=1 Tax=Parathielavia hyrcaniae TaxID=113614 RepID=A0AAN6T6P5_9PEZI|nr:hypothetical protein N658DRAFT_2594 [Parathielavia hyrcaniae]